MPQLLPDVDEALAFLRQRVSGELRSDSRQIAAGDGFLAWAGRKADGRAHVREALARGAAACLVDAAGAQALELAADRVAALPDLKSQVGVLASRWLGEPSRYLKVLAVTGTNGKTSTACGWPMPCINSRKQSRQRWVDAAS